MHGSYIDRLIFHMSFSMKFTLNSFRPKLLVVLTFLDIFFYAPRHKYKYVCITERMYVEKAKTISNLELRE